MRFVSDPPIADKIHRMKQRVRWQQAPIADRGIDQTRMVIEDSEADNPEFSFLVIGDSGSGGHRGHNPQRQIAKMMLEHKDSCRFLLHTGDVMYLVGSSEYYPENFIKPYREFLVDGEEYEHIAYNQMVFNTPFLPVLGNHDYYDLPLVYGLLTGTTLPLRRLLRSQLDLDVGWHGSGKGRAYARAFLDYLKDFNTDGELDQHLERHYTAKTETGRCLLYQPEKFTRLPNRYYMFRYGGIDFFALDSNTFNEPDPLPANQEGEEARRQLEKRRDELEQEKLEIVATSAKLNPNDPDEAEQLDDLHAKLEQIEEVKLDIDKQLASDAKTTVVDIEQLDWLKQRLIDSWHNVDVRGRVIYLHHPPYVTEATKWQQAQTMAIRNRLRYVFDEVSKAVGSFSKERPLVDLILTGHAHCLEHLRTCDTGHADSNINWVICGGSGYSLRRQRIEGPELMEDFADHEGERTRKVAESLLYVGRSGQGSKKRRPYSFLRIDVHEGNPPKLIVRPIVAERFRRKWERTEMKPLILG